MRGRPPGRDFRFQNRGKPCRCQRTNVSGLTVVRACRQRKESGKHDQGQLGSCPGSTRLDMALQIQSWLFGKEEILGGRSTARLKAKADEPPDTEQ